MLLISHSTRAWVGNSVLLQRELCMTSALTVCVTGDGAIVRTEARLHLPFSQLEFVRICQLCPANVAHPLLLACATLSHVDWHPWCPRSVPSHLRTRLQITGLVFLQNEQGTGMWPVSEVQNVQFICLAPSGQSLSLMTDTVAQRSWVMWGNCNNLMACYHTLSGEVF